MESDTHNNVFPFKGETKDKKEMRNTKYEGDEKEEEKKTVKIKN